MKSKFTLLFAILFLFNYAVNAQIRYLKGVLQSSQEVPVSNSAASGVVIVKYNTSTNLLELYGNYRNLTANINNSHIHGPAAPGVNAGVLYNISNTGGTSGTLSGTPTLTEAQEVNLLAGNTYVNVHSVGPYTGGEIRAQLTVTTDGQTEFFNARLQGAQQTPPNGSLATGAVSAIIDKATNTLYLTGNYTGLTAAASNAHIHTGGPGASGGVIVPLNFTTATTGTLDTSMVLTATVRDNILTGNTYVNVHTPGIYSAGEIRGQLTQLSQMWFFANALQGSQEFPVNASPAKGTVIVKYNSTTNLLELTGDYQNLNASISGSHIHGPAGPGVNAPVLFNLTNTGGTIGTLSGSFTLTEPQEADLLAGNMYTNVHSTGTYSAGEIRAQLLPAANGSTQYITGNMQVSQSVSGVAIVSSGTGSAYVLLDKLTNKVHVTGSFTNLSSNISDAHIHGGAAGVNGGVVIPLSFAGTTSGTITGTATVRSTFADSMVNGLSYVNIHTISYGGGEIRAQLGDLVLPVKLKLFNGYKDRDKIVLVWETEEETNLSHYEIEQQDMVTLRWISKVSLPGSGRPSGNNYRVDDIPLAGTGSYVYYRLKIIDKDGRYSYSRIVRINYLKPGAEVTLLSNPIVNGELRFIITGLSVDKKAEVSIVDFNGKRLAQKIVSTFTNNSMSLKKLSAGMYKLVVRIEDKILQQTFIK
ncbi:MAG: CHRD domain-containing protein [Ferruginibacter sp.]|nr:CHRD domain-containing protein [Ferruginibacter sp.]